MTAETHPVEREQLMAYLDGELAGNEAARVATHLAECADCRQLEADLRSVSAQMLSWNVEPAPQQLNDGVLAALQANPSLRSAREPWNLLRFIFQHRLRIARWALAAACVCVAALVLIRVFAPSAVSNYLTEPAAELATRAHLNPYSNSSRDSKAPAHRGEAIVGAFQAMPAPASPAVGLADKTKSFSRSQQAAEAREEAKMASNMDENFVLPTAPMIARTASLKISAKDFQSARAGVDRIIASFHGFAASMTINNAVGEPQSLNAELHFPAAQCDAALAALKGLGRVEQEQQGGEEVIAQVVDLDARLKNARETETRLRDILKTRTGKVTDVLEVENQIAETRQNIEQMEGEKKQLHDRVTFSAITLDLHEEYQASLETNDPSAGRRIRNAVVDGFRAAAEGSLALLVFLLSAGPSLLLAAIIMFWPIRWVWRRLRNSAAVPAPAR
jgi:anti-sigma factor RsiW